MTIKQYIKNDKKYYMFQVYLGKDPITNKERRTTRRGFKTKKEAELALAKIKVEINVNGLQSTQIKTFKELYELWYEGYKKSVKGSTLLSKKSILNEILSHFKDLEIKKITIAYCQKVTNLLSEKHKAWKLYISCIKNILKLAVNMQIIKANPMEYITYPKKQVDDVKVEDLYYTKEELQSFFTILEEYSLMDRVLFRMLAFTGARKGEILALEWSDINFKDKTVSITKTLSKDRKGKLITQSPKTKSSKRIISLDNVTINLLKEYKINRKIINKLVFTHHSLFLQLNYLNVKMKKICEDHNLKKIKIHGFRHTHCSLCFEAGLTVQEVQHRLGHSDIQTTMSIYAHITKNQKDKIAEKFSKYVNF